MKIKGKIVASYLKYILICITAFILSLGADVIVPDSPIYNEEDENVVAENNTAETSNVERDGEAEIDEEFATETEATTDTVWESAPDATVEI